MKRVDASEFAEHAAEYLAAGEPISVEQDGEVIGRYEPMPHAANGTATNGHATTGVGVSKQESEVDQEFRELSERLQRTLDAVYAETGLTEDELVDLLDPKKPFPYDKVPEA